MPTRRYLAGGLRLTDDHRFQLNSQIDRIEEMTLANDSAQNRKDRLGLLAKMLLAYPISGGSEEAGRARAEAYLVSLDDVPPWTIAESIRRWHRGECGNRNYRFAPAPAELREVCRDILDPAAQVVLHLRAVLDAMTLEQAMDTKSEADSRQTNLIGNALKVIR